MAVYFAFLKPGDTVLGMDLAHGGHLTHGSPVNFSGRLYRFVSYGVKKETGTIDFDQVWKQAKEHKPKMIVTGASAYPRFWDFEKFREIADSVGAFLMADIAHPAGLVAAGLHSDPLPFCHVVTTTTHKTLRGPRGFMIIHGQDTENPFGITALKSGRVKMMSEILDSHVMPGIQGGPLMHIIAAKAVAFQENLQPDYKKYCKQIISNAQTLAQRLVDHGYHLVSGGTDNHLILVDLTSMGMTGKEAQAVLEKAGIVCNRNTIPYDTQKPFVTSGIRLGTPAMTTRGMKESEMKETASLLTKALEKKDDESALSSIEEEVKALCSKFPVYENYRLV